MSFVKDTFDSFTGKAGAKAAKSAGKTQAAATVRAAEIAAESGDKALAAAERGRQEARADLQPFRDFGASQFENINSGLGTVQSDLDQIRDLVTDPNQQKQFVEDNPFFKALAEDAQRRIFGKSAAGGKFASGGTAEALQNSILLLGNDLVNQNVNQRQNVVGQGLNINNQRLGIAQLGANAAAGQAGASQGAASQAINSITNTGNTIADLTTQGANAIAAGEVGAANARAQGINNALQIGGIVALSDANEKENITFLKEMNGVPWYLFEYKGRKGLKLGTMAHKVPHAVIKVGSRDYVDYARI